MSFAHLHVHTEYSLLDGSNKVKEYVKRLQELGMKAGAITDHGNMYGVIEFYKAATEAGINPILGCEVYVAPGSRFDKETTGGEDRYHHLVLLAENNQGYSNLMKIVSKGFTEGYYYRPRVDMEVLKTYHEGIIALSACLAGAVPRLLEKGLYEEAKACALEYRDCFGEGNYFLELQDHGIPMQRTVNSDLLRMSRELNIPLVCTNDVHYTYEDDAEAHDLLLCVQTGKKVSDTDRMRYEGGQYYVKSEEEMRQLFPYAEEALENTGKIADRCHVEIEFHVTKLPHYECPEGYSSETYLRHLCDEGMKLRYPEDDGSLRERLLYELSVIEKMGYVDYFLIVWDYINYCRENGIAVGPGRGSAAGSIVSYCLKITNIDPVRYNLLFERFLNPERVSMPDIDVDFCFERRQEVIDYVGRKYGADKVVQIITFGTMAAKGVIRDVARVLDYPYSMADSLAKMVPNELNITLEKAISMNPELRKLYEEDEQVHYLLTMAKRLEGLPRNTSTHAAGVVICQKPADEFVPLSRGADGAITTQFTMTTIEELGLLKMDFLGLRTLTVIQNAVKLAEKSCGHAIDIDAIDYNDKQVLDLIGTGKCEGIFQLESGGMKGFMKELKPQNLEDVIAGISLYRPGPMDFIPKYIKGKNDIDAIRYECPQLEPILAPTYGCIVYQEQVMQIVRELAGYSMGQADNIRRAMSKKKQYVIDAERKNFVNGNSEEHILGCAGNGIDAEVANRIYDSMLDFAKYAFNKSHAACYAVVSYQTAWLKYYFPVEFMAALMTSCMDNAAKTAQYILVCRSMGIEILPPDINLGEAGFSVSDGKIRYSLNAIKSVGRPVIDAVIRERENNGRFRDIRDFIERMSGGERDVNKRAIENFIKAGAFDGLGGNRRQYIGSYEKLVDQVHQKKKNDLAGQISLFDIVAEEDKHHYEFQLPSLPEFDREVLLGYEKEVLGTYVSGHPLEEYEDLWRNHITRTTADFFQDEESGYPKVEDGEKVTIGGLLTEKKIKYTKNNKIMAFLTIEDLVGAVEVIIFPRDYERNSEKIQEDAKVFLTGRVSVEEEKDAKLICEEIRLFEEEPRKLWLRFDTMEQYHQLWEKLEPVLRASDGKDTVIIYIAATRSMKTLPPNRSVCCDALLLQELQRMLPAENIKIV